MQFSITDNSPATRKRLDSLIRRYQQNKKPAMTAAILQAQTIIKTRTAKGVDVDGAPFKPYSKTYAAFRSKKGLSTTPDLMFRGAMMASMKATASKNEGVLFFNTSENAKKAAFNNRTRRFFDLSKKELTRIQQVYFRRLTRER